MWLGHVTFNKYLLTYTFCAHTLYNVRFPCIRNSFSLLMKISKQVPKQSEISQPDTFLCPTVQTQKTQVELIGGCSALTWPQITKNTPNWRMPEEVS